MSDLPVLVRQLQGIVAGMFGDPAIQVRIGTVTLPFSASRYSSTITVPHDLGRTPRVVIVSNQFIAGVASVAGMSSTWTSSQFLAAGWSDVSWTGSTIHGWAVIG